MLSRRTLALCGSGGGRPVALPASFELQWCDFTTVHASLLNLLFTVSDHIPVRRTMASGFKIYDSLLAIFASLHMSVSVQVAQPILENVYEKFNSQCSTDRARSPAPPRKAKALHTKASRNFCHPTASVNGPSGMGSTAMKMVTSNLPERVSLQSGNQLQDPHMRTPYVKECAGPLQPVLGMTATMSTHLQCHDDYQRKSPHAIKGNSRYCA